MVVSCATACIIFGQVIFIGVDFQYHTTVIECCDCLILGCRIFEELFYLFIVFLVGRFCSEAIATNTGRILLLIALA